MNEETLHEKLEQYVRGQLPPEEAASLEREIAGSPTLQEQLRLHQLELESQEYLLRQRLKENVRQWVSDEIPESQAPGPSSASSKWRLPLFLLTLGLLAVFLFFFLNPGNEKESEVLPPLEKTESLPDSTPAHLEPIAQTPPPKESPPNRPDRRLFALVKSNYTPPPYIQDAMQRGTDPKEKRTDPLSVGIEAYKDGKYPAAIHSFEQITAQADPAQYGLAKEWRAHAWFQIGLQNNNFSQAAALFQSIMEANKDNVTRDRAEWYLLLCLVPDYQRQQKRVDGLLDQIIQQEYHSFRDDAVQLKKDLHR